MITPATRIRNKIYEILRPLENSSVKTIRCVPVGLLQPDDLPAITIALLNERLTPNGDDNAGAFNFDSEVTIGVSVVRGFAAKAIDLDVKVDADADLIQRMLLSDADFTRFGVDTSLPEDDPNYEPFFEAITGITRRRNYPQSGEAYFVEVRLEFSFRTSIDFEVCVDAEPLQTVSIRTRRGTAQTPQSGVDITFPDNP